MLPSDPSTSSETPLLRPGRKYSSINRLCLPRPSRTREGSERRASENRVVPRRSWYLWSKIATEPDEIYIVLIEVRRLPCC